MDGASTGVVHSIDSLRAPLLVSWQITRDCNLACVHCCTDSAPGKGLPDEMGEESALSLAAEIIRYGVPYVMLCGGEPLIVPHFMRLAETLGRGGVQLKIETNGQEFNATVARDLARLPIRSIQISLDADTQETYQRQRPGASLEKAHRACLLTRDAGLPLEVTFAPTRVNIHEAGAVIRRARSFGAFRFNTGGLMRIGTAVRLWDKLEPSAEQYRQFRRVLAVQSQDRESAMELCYAPFDIRDGMRRTLVEPPATLLVLPNGYVKVAAALPLICADLRNSTLGAAWDAYRAAWRNNSVAVSLRRAITDQSRHAEANTWRLMSPVSS